jgi:hypothetical protein
MKPQSPIPKLGAKKAGRFSRSSLAPIPMEWMDPISWRLPSGKALAEFALQAGFLAPLMLSGPTWKKKKAPAPAAPVAASEVRLNQVGLHDAREERPEHSGTFRETR